jgi:hypothetical protein
VGEASIRAFSQRGGSGFNWANCWVGFEAQRVADKAELVYGLVNGPVHGLVHVSILGPVHGSVIGSNPNPYLDPGSDLGFSIDSSSNLSDPLPVASSPRPSMQDIPLGNDDYLSHRELEAVIAMRGDRASDFKPMSPVHASFQPVHAGDHPFDPLTSALPSSADSSTSVLVVEAEEVFVPHSSPTFTFDAIVDSGLKKSEKWLIESFREVVKDDVTHMAILKDSESFSQASKEARDVLSPKEDWNLASRNEEIERFLGGRLLVSALVPPKANRSDQVLVTDAHLGPALF